MNTPLHATLYFTIGPVQITQAILTTWAIMLLLVGTAVPLTWHLTLSPTKPQAAIELIVDMLDTQIRETTGAEPAPYRSFIGTLFVFILTANWASLLPGIEPPTAKLETDAALAAIVFASVIWFGIRGAGVPGYLRSFAAPNIAMIPLNLLESVTRVFSMFVRLFGNVMSGVFRHWHCRLAGGAIGADPADGARSADGPGAGLYLSPCWPWCFIAATVEDGQPKPAPPPQKKEN